MPVKKNHYPECEGDPDEVPEAVRLQMAHDHYLDQNKKTSIRQVAREHGVRWETLRDRIKGAKPKAEVATAQQRLSPIEEAAIQRHIMKLEVWGWPPMVHQVQKMAIELLKAQGEDLTTNPLGINWHRGFLNRHLDLKSRIVPPLNKDRVIAEDPEQIARYFELYRTKKAEYNIHDDDVYNMDEKGVIMGILAKVRVICSRKTKKPKITQQGSREWVSLIECISSSGQVLSPFVIFKAKVLYKDWVKALPNGHICASEKGWTDDELCVEWFQRVFEPETSKVKKGEYRMLLFDGHGSHVTPEVVRFCEEKKVILLCLPAHSTHILQPCDVGVFGPLAQSYRRYLTDKTRWGAGYSIDKIKFLEILQLARADAFNHQNIMSSWRKCGLFPFDPEVVIGQLPAVILQREEEAEKARMQMPPPPATSISRPTTSGNAAPLVVATPQNVADVKAILKVTNEINGKIKVVTESQNRMRQNQAKIRKQITDLQHVVQKLANSATIALTATSLSQAVNKELIEVADAHKNRKKVSKKDEDKITDARVLNVALMEKALEAKAMQKKEREEEVAIQKRLKAITRSWKSLYNQTLNDFRKWGPDMLQEVEDIVALEDRLSKPLKVSKTPKPRQKKALPASPPIEYTLPKIDFPSIPPPPEKPRSTTLLPPLPSSPTSTLSPSTQRSPKKPKRQRRTKTKEVVHEVIEPPAIVTNGGRKSKRRLFHDEVLARARANQGEA